ncbi:hypothetical protein HDU76_004392 [Blyttiomyces sp. JEL0837]|nr:hypothetical protein HDU76_004392 [Blyttiomyces sp. JEL0837]
MVTHHHPSSSSTSTSIKKMLTSTAIFSLAYLVWGISAQCTAPYVRREWTQLSSTEKQAYIDAVKNVVKKGITYQTSNPETIGYYDFVSTHTHNAAWAHANSQFYPYHRAMLFMFEQALANNGWSGGVPYMDWSWYSQNWPTHDIFNYIGHQGDANSNFCLTDGQFSSSTYNVSPDPPTGPGKFRNTDSTCLRRCGSTGSAMDSPSSINDILNAATSYTQFRKDDSVGYHADGHVLMGGNCDMGNFYYSPNDPLFFLHHAMVDRIWWKFQQICPEYQTDYEGYLNPGDPATNGNTVPTLDEQLDSWPFKVRDVISTTSGVLCYTYSKTPADTDLNAVKCPSGKNPVNNPWNTSPPPPPPSTTTTNPPPPQTTSTSTNGGGPQPSSSPTLPPTSTTDSITSTAASVSKISITPQPTVVNSPTWFQELINSLVVIGTNETVFGGHRRDTGNDGPIFPLMMSDMIQSQKSKDSLPLNHGWHRSVSVIHGGGADNSTLVVFDHDLSTKKGGHLNVTVPVGWEVYRIYTDRVVVVPVGSKKAGGVGVGSFSSTGGLRTSRPAQFKVLHKPNLGYPTSVQEFQQIVNGMTLPAPHPDKVLRGALVRVPEMIEERVIRERHLSWEGYLGYRLRVLKSVAECNADLGCKDAELV